LQGRVGEFKYEPELPVNTAWDLGVGDATAIWFWQKLRGKVQLIGYYENSGEGLPHYINVLKQYQQRNEWTYASHIVPPDARVKEFGTGRTRVEEMLSAGIYPTVCAAHSIEDGINSVRASLPHCYFDEAECSTGLRHLKAYRKDWDETRGCWKDKPRHDSSSHAADSLRYLCMAYREVSADPVKEPTTKEIIRDMCKPKTMADAWKEYATGLRERDDAELPEEFDDFALSKPTRVTKND
jgi:phage terminase large subunit